MKAEDNGNIKVEAKGAEAALIYMTAACLAQLCSRMKDEIIESGIFEKEAED